MQGQWIFRCESKKGLQGLYLVRRLVAFGTTSSTEVISRDEELGQTLMESFPSI